MALQVISRVGWFGHLLNMMRLSISKEPNGSCITFYDLATQVTQCHVYCSHNSGEAWGSKGGDIDPTSGRAESHYKRACGMEEMVAAILGEI